MTMHKVFQQAENGPAIYYPNKAVATQGVDLDFMQTCITNARQQIAHIELSKEKYMPEYEQKMQDYDEAAKIYEEQAKIFEVCKTQIKNFNQDIVKQLNVIETFTKMVETGTTKGRLSVSNEGKIETKTGKRRSREFKGQTGQPMNWLSEVKTLLQTVGTFLSWDEIWSSFLKDKQLQARYNGKIKFEHNKIGTRNSYVAHAKLFDPKDLKIGAKRPQILGEYGGKFGLVEWFGKDRRPLPQYLNVFVHGNGEVETDSRGVMRATLVA